MYSNISREIPVKETEKIDTMIKRKIYKKNEPCKIEQHEHNRQENRIGNRNRIDFGELKRIRSVH